MIQNKFITRKTQELNATSEEVWQRLRKLDGIEELVPEIIGNSWVIENTDPGVGTMRACSVPGQPTDEASMVEKVLDFNDEEKFYSYTVTEGLPVKNMLNSFKVENMDAGKSKVIWESSMEEFIENPNMTESEFMAFVTSTGDALMEGLVKIYNN